MKNQESQPPVDGNMEHATKIQSACSVGLCRKRKGLLQTSAAGYSDIGNVRPSNEDLVFASNDCRLFVVLDGVGGYAGGSEASLIVLEKLRANIEAMCEKNPEEANQELEQGVRKALKAATKSMLHIAHEHPDLARMSTVFALAYVVEGLLLYTHVGDCRAYVIRNGKVKRLTSDETFVQLMVEKGVIDPEDVARHPMRNVILNSVGTRTADYDPTIHSMMLVPGDTVILTTDGVTDYLSDDELASVESSTSDPVIRSKAIVDAALAAGSRDNVSCVVVNIARAPSSDEDARADLHFELANLHDLLGQVDSIDDELRQELVEIAGDIRVALKEPAPSGLAQLTSRLEDKTLGFEVRPPKLTALVASVTNMLSRIGI